MSEQKSFRTFDDFHPFYLSEHGNRTSRGLHFAGTSIAVALLVAAVCTRKWWLIGAALLQDRAAIPPRASGRSHACLILGRIVSW